MEERLAALERRVAAAEQRFWSVQRARSRVTMLGLCLAALLSLLLLATTTHCTRTLNALDGFARTSL